MDPTGTLLTIAEVSIAVIGFAGIVSVLRPSSSPAADSMHRLRMRIMVETSAYVVAFSFLPLVLVSAEIPKAAVWSLGSAALAISAPFQVASIYVRQRRIFGSSLLRETLLFDASTILLALCIEIMLLVNALGIFFTPRFAGYLVGLLFPLWTAVAMFVRAILSSDGLTPRASAAREPAPPQD